MTPAPLTAERAAALRDEHRLSFPILRDEGNAYAAQLGLRMVLPDDLRAVYAGFGIDLPASNGEASQSLPLPARYLVAADGTVAWAAVHPDYTRRPEPEETLEALRALVG